MKNESQVSYLRYTLYLTLQQMEWKGKVEMLSDIHNHESESAEVLLIELLKLQFDHSTFSQQGRVDNIGKSF